MKILMSILIVIILLSLVSINKLLVEREGNYALLNKIREINEIQKEGNKDFSNNNADTTEQKEPTTIQEMNEDYVGWLSIEDTMISYPVVQGDDNDSYLNLNFYKNKSVYGSIYLDYRNKSDDRLKIIYGHNTTDGQMFAPLLNYMDQIFASKHQYINFADCNYKVISVNEVFIGEDEAYWNLMLYSSDRINKVLQSYVDKSIYESDTKVIDRNYLILSTCIQGMDEKRFILIAEEIHSG